MRKYSCVLTLLLLLLNIPLLAQDRSQDSRSHVKVFNTSPKPSLPPSNSWQLEFVSLEDQFWKAMVRKDFKILNDLVAKDALFIDDGSVVSKAEFTRALSSHAPSQYLFTGLKVRKVTSEVCIVSYKVKAKFISNSTQLPAQSAVVTSIWVHEEGRWRLKHHHYGSIPVTKAEP